MNALIYYICFPIIYLVSLMPFSVLYLLSDTLFFILYYLIGYRKKVVVNNLKKSFPNKSEKEIEKITVEFYQYLCDLILETIKTLSISKRTLRKHIVFEDLSIFKKYFNEKQSVIIVMGHWGNWELSGAAFSQTGLHTLYVIYHPLTNKYFDKMFYYMRTRLGNKLYAMNDVLRGMLRDRELITATAFIADQTPFPQNAYWTTFLNQDTPIFTGTEKIAKKFNYPVIYVAVQRVKRGRYKIKSELLMENPKDSKENEISEMHTRRLEKDILEQPEIWLWTHRRWKHKRV